MGSHRADKAYVLDGQECWTLNEVVTVMAERPGPAVEHLKGGYVGRWVENALGDIDAKIALDKLLNEELPDEEVLYAFLARHWADGAPPFRAVTVTMEQLDRIARDDVPEGIDKRQFVCDLHRFAILPKAAQASGDVRLAEIDARWQKEFLDYCTGHAEMLSYGEIWNDRGGALDVCLADPHTEAFFINHFMNDRRDAVAARCFAHGAKVHIFDGLFDTEYADRRRFDRNAENVADLRKRAWFAAMLDRETESSLGRDHALTIAAMIAAGESGALSRKLEASHEEIASAGQDWPFRTLNQKAHAILYGGAMAFASVLGIWNPFGWYLSEKYETGTTIALLIAAFFFVTLYAAAARDRHNMKMLGIGFVTMTFGAVLIAMIASGWWLTDVAIFGGLFALLGYLRRPFIAYLVKRRLDEGRNEIEKQVAGSSCREDDHEVVLGYLDFHAHGIPRDKILEHARHQQFMGQSSAPDLSIAPDGRPRKTAPAAYQSEGLSYNLAGMNVGSDGAITTEVVDGLSIDTRGRVNTRLVDGVTLHSDGKSTVKVIDGVDIRSDGQMSVEMFGMRHSWGGKKEEKKKDSWF